ncbi:MAG: discoidin domain-containing protein, partial [Reichenbachiella sp.]
MGIQFTYKCIRFSANELKKKSTILLSLFLYCNGISAPENLALNQPVIVSSEYNTTYIKENAVDGIISDDSRWLSAAESESWIKIVLDSATLLGGIHFYSGYEGGDAVSDFRIEFVSNGSWLAIPSAVVTGNSSLGVSVAFDAAVEVRTDTLRIIITGTKTDIARVHEISVWGYSETGIPKLGTGVTGYYSNDPVVVPVIYINQSGYNLNKPKRFTAPTLQDGTPFSIKEVNSGSILYTGVINNSLGDFTSF